MATYTVHELGALNFGNPDAKISLKQKVEKGALSQELLSAVGEIIRSGECMVDITEADDGCVDGRIASSILFLDEEGSWQENAIDNPEDHQRSKLAGGGYLTGVHMRRGMGLSRGHVDEDLAQVIDDLADENIFCGLHTGDHGSETGTDCGANDKADSINAIREQFIEQIDASTHALLAEAGVVADVEAITDAKNALTPTDGYFGNSTGASRFALAQKKLQDIQMAKAEDHPVAVSKHLGGSHGEIGLIVNYAEGKTFSQAAFTRALAIRFPEIAAGDLPQMFVVDVPRIVKIAQALSSRAQSDNTELAFQRALYAGVDYQVSTLATLTDGSLPMYAVHAA